MLKAEASLCADGTCAQKQLLCDLSPNRRQMRSADAGNRNIRLLKRFGQSHQSSNRHTDFTPSRLPVTQT